MDSKDALNSLCAIYVHLIRREIREQGALTDKIDEYLTVIEENCSIAPYKKGETPEHLEEYLIEKGGEEEGTTTYKGKPIPKSAKKLIEEE